MKRILNLFILLLSSVVTVQAQWFPQDGGVYRITNTVRENAVLVENYITNKLKGGAESLDCNDLWLFKKSGEGWYIQNVLTERYIQIEESNSNLYRTGTTPNKFYVKRNNTFSIECYNIINKSDGNWGIHCESDFDIVPWYSSTTSLDGSEWTVKQAQYTEEQLAAARLKMENTKKLFANEDAIKKAFVTFFEDAACTKLKSEYQAMSDAELAAAMEICGDELISIATKIKNNTWAKREKEFRVSTYAPYSNPDHWSERLVTFSYSWLNNPTGICAEGNEILFVFVGEDPKSGSTLELDAVVKNNNARGLRTTLKKGMNIIPVTGKDVTFFIVYTADTRSSKVIADFDSIPIHIEGGYVNGYWDKGRHTDADWVDITRNHAKSKYIFVKGDNIMYFMNRSILTSSNVCPKTISDAIGWWDNMIMWQQEIMGFEDVRPSRFNNRLCAISYAGDGLMSATNHVTNYVEGCLHEVLAYNKIMESSGFCWGPSHENGHVHQGAINMIGCSEASNNLFSNISVFKLGKFVTWGDGVDMMADYYENKVAWSLQGIGLKMRMFWQLYLYYHVAGNNPQFYPNLFKLLRESPMKKTAGGTTSNFGRNDLLHFAEKCCEAAGEDMTKFFEAWGFFVPMSQVKIDDYGTFSLSSTQRMIDDAKKKMAAYPKKAAAIEFIEDRVAPSLRTDGGEGYKLEYVDGKFGELGQYTAFMEDSIKVRASGYVYSKSGNTITISKGTGAVGFKVYDSDSTLITFANVHTLNLSNEIIAKDLIIVALSADGTEVTVNSKNNGSEADQLEALNEAIASANNLLALKDNGCKNIGYYHAHVLVNLTSLVESANAVVANKDQSERTYGEWATLIEKEISSLMANSDNRVKLHSGNTYQLYNARYQQYSMFCESGKLYCKVGSTTPKARRFTFTATDKEDEFIISNNGAYINFIGRSQQATANSSKKADAVKFTVGEHGLGTFYIYKTGDTGLGLHSSQGYDVVGWNHTEGPSLWRIVNIDFKKEKADAAALKTLVEEAVSIHDLIVDTTATAADITFKEGVQVLSETLSADVAKMVNLAEESQEIVTSKNYALCPEYITALTEIIATVKAGYTVGTGIGGILSDEKDSKIYDIRGRRIDRITRAGIYIIDGKKVYKE